MTTDVLDLLERLLIAAKHPDITAIERYGPGSGPWGPTVEKTRTPKMTGVLVTYQSTATASLWEALDPDAYPVPAPDPVPPARRRAVRFPMLVAQLLDAAQPAGFRSWHLAGFPGIGLDSENGQMPYGLMLIGADGSKSLLRSTATGPTLGQEPTEEPFPDYTIPEGVAAALA